MSCLFVLLVVSLGGAARAHEIGTTRVAVRFAPDGAYAIDIATDAVSLLARLEIAAGDPRSDTADAGELQRQLLARLPALRQQFTIGFDGAAAAAPQIRVAVSPAIDVNGTAQAALRMTGMRPPRAQQFTWSWSLTSASYALSVATAPDRAPLTQWLTADETSAVVALDTVAAAPAESRPGLARKYVVLGFTHILPGGLDHVLFVLGIFLLSRRVRPVLLQVSAFTIAHSITLGLSIYNIVSVQASIVEPLIALSIAYIAIENVVSAEVRASRVAVVFAFGLLHGLGFAGALREIGLPRSEFLTALLGFNVGVELGQLAVISLAFVLVGHWFGDREWYRRRVVLPASAGIAACGLIWTIQRLHLV
ncbi:MAG: HupE/UreJ family protein [Acidobacteriota bacterium]